MCPTTENHPHIDLKVDLISDAAILTVNGPVLTAKGKVLEEKFNVPPERCLKDRGWLQHFYKV